MMAQASASESEAESSERESEGESSSASSSDSESDAKVAVESEVHSHTHSKSKWDHATTWDKDHPHPGYPPSQDGFEGNEGLGGYNRNIPERFSGPGEGNDEFMHNSLKNHAHEEATEGGKPTGKFFYNKSSARHHAKEILETHMSLKGDKAEKYLDENFDKTWDHFDVNKEGKVEAARMPGFYRFLTGNQQIPLHL
jgi:hypothetical protein